MRYGKAVLTWKFIAVDAYIKKEQKFLNQKPNLTPYKNQKKKSKLNPKLEKRSK